MRPCKLEVVLGKSKSGRDGLLSIVEIDRIRGLARSPNRCKCELDIRLRILRMSFHLLLRRCDLLLRRSRFLSCRRDNGRTGQRRRRGLSGGNPAADKQSKQRKEAG